MVFIQLKSEITFLFFTRVCPDAPLTLRVVWKSTEHSSHEQIRNVRNIFLIKFKCMCPKRSSNILTISGSSNFPIAIFRAQLSLYVHIYIHTYVRCIYLHYNKAVILLLCHTEHMNLKSQEETAVKIFESFPVRTADGRQMHTRGLQVQPSPAEEKCSSEVCVSKCTAALLLSAQTASAQGILAHYHPMKHEKGWDVGLL